MKAELIYVGGRPNGADSGQGLIEKLNNRGVQVIAETDVEIDAVKLKRALKSATDRSQFTIIIGGVGIKDTDITVKTVSDAIGVETRCDQAALAAIADQYAEKGEPLPDGAYRGAVIPAGATPLYSKKGDMGCALSAGEQWIVMLPSDPESLNNIVDEKLMPIVQSVSRTVSSARAFYAVDVSQRAEDELVAEFSGEQGVDLSVERNDGLLTVVLTTVADNEDDARLKGLSAAVKVRGILGDDIYSEEDKTIEQIAVELLREQGKTVATAESCTAGLLSKRLTDVSGSSDVFSMGVAAYSADIKTKVLGVPRELIEQNGTVCAKVAESMAYNVRRLSGCSFGVGITGVAGDSFEEKPSGLVYVSLTDGEKMWTRELKVDVEGMDDSRTSVRNTSATVALDMLRRVLMGTAQPGEPVAVETGICFGGTKTPAKEQPTINLVFEESAIKTAEEEGRVDDGIILPADEKFETLADVDEALYYATHQEEPAPQESAEPILPLPEETPKKEEAAPMMDEDFILQDAAQDAPAVKKPNFFVRLLKNFIPWKGDTLSKVLTKCLFIVIIICLIVSSCYVGDFMAKYFNNNSIISDARDNYDRENEEVNPETGVYDRFEPLLEQNDDCKGWITVPNTNVDNPVYQTDNNEFYLDHNSIKEKSVYGAIFVDCRSRIDRNGNSKNVTLYGHHMKDGSMFAQLHKYKNVSFYKENPVISFDTIYGTGGEYKIIACMITNASSLDDNGYFFDFAVPSFRSDADFMSWIEQIRRRSLYNTSVDVNTSDEILTLSTCTYEVKSANLLCVVVARKVREGESVAVNTSDVKTNSKVIYPQAWYDRFGGVKPTYSDGLYTWVSGDYDREDINAPGSIPPASVPESNPESTPSDTPSTPPSDTPSTTPSDTPSTTPSDTPSTTPSDTPSTTPSETPSTTPSETPSETPTESVEPQGDGGGAG